MRLLGVGGADGWTNLSGDDPKRTILAHVNVRQRPDSNRLHTVETYWIDPASEALGSIAEA
jgi:hypothetical protein